MKRTSINVDFPNESTLLYLLPFVLSLVLAVLTGCTSVATTKGEELPTSSSPNDTVFPSPVSAVNTTIASCPLTIPNGSTPPNARPSPNRHGNGTLWVDLWPENKILVEPNQVDVDGSIGVKFGWYRGVSGQLTIEGRRLDAPALPLQADILDGYGDSGFQASGILFPSEGCWEITGIVSDVKLTFVTLLIRIPFDILWPAWSPAELILIHESSDVTDLPRSIRIVYGSPSGGEVVFKTIQGLQESVVPYPKTSIQQVTVNGQPGICVKGDWDKQGQWQADADAGALEWSDNGLIYQISHTGLKLRCDDLLRMATSPS